MPSAGFEPAIPAIRQLQICALDRKANTIARSNCLKRSIMGEVMGPQYSDWVGHDDQGFCPGRSKRYFFPPKNPDQLWGPSSILFNFYVGFLTRRKDGQNVKLTLSFILAQRLRMSGAIPLLPLHAFTERTKQNLKYFFIASTEGVMGG